MTDDFKTTDEPEIQELIEKSELPIEDPQVQTMLKIREERNKLLKECKEK